MAGRTLFDTQIHAESKMVDDSTSPAFRPLDPTEEFQAPSISKLGMVAVGLGVLGLVAIMAPSMIVVSISAVVAAVGAAILGIKSDDGGSGIKLGTIGGALGVFGAVWSGVSLQTKNDYLYREAGKHAEVFMAVVASGDIYQALELTLPEPDRQITGTDLEKYYYSLSQEQQEVALSFFDTPAGRRVTSETEAEWKFLQGYTVKRLRGAALITVIMEDETTPGSDPVYIRLHRAEGVVIDDPDAVLWNIDAVLAASDAARQ